MVFKINVVKCTHGSQGTAIASVAEIHHFSRKLGVSKTQIIIEDILFAINQLQARFACLRCAAGGHYLSAWVALWAPRLPSLM